MAPSSKSTSTRSETKLVQELADILDQAGLAELEYETEAVAIRLSRVSNTAPAVAMAPAAAATVSAASPNKQEKLFYGNRLCQISGFINIVAQNTSCMIS